MEDYREYRLSGMEKMEALGISFVLAGTTAFLFYNHILGMLWGIPLFLLVKTYLIREKKKKRNGRLSKEFEEVMQVMVTSMIAGSSMENALKDAKLELTKEHGEEALMVRELLDMNKKIALHTPVEDLFLDFGNRSGNEDIYSLGEIVSFAKRSGGNLVLIMENTLFHMREKWDMKGEIEIVIAGKRLEQIIMDLVPMAILLYLRLTSFDYLSKLYEFLSGRLIMTVCLIVYGAALLLSNIILEKAFGQ